MYVALPQAYRWAITSIVEVPICTSKVANKLGIESDFTAVKSYIIQSLKVGMTPTEVESALGKVGSVEIVHSFIDENQEVHAQVLIRLCENPLGNVLLFVKYSEDGHLLNAVDAYED